MSLPEVTRRGPSWLWLSWLVVLLDQISKYAASVFLLPGSPVPLFPGANLTLVHNSGAAFGFLGEAGGWQRWFFIALTSGVVCVLFFWLRGLSSQTHGRSHYLACALALILGGALGNLADRLLHGHVVDFIDVYYQGWHWPAFNVADSAITVGAVMLLVDLLRQTDD